MLFDYDTSKTGQLYTTWTQVVFGSSWKIKKRQAKHFSESVQILSLSWSGSNYDSSFYGI